MLDFEYQITNSIFVVRYSNCRCFSSYKGQKPVLLLLLFDIQNCALKVSFDIKNLVFGNFPNAEEGFRPK